MQPNNTEYHALDQGLQKNIENQTKHILNCIKNKMIPQRPLVSNFYSCILKSVAQMLGRDTRFHSDVIRFTRCFDVTHRSENWRDEYEFVSYNIPTFWLFSLNGFDFNFLLPIYRSCIENISRIKRCDNLGLSLRSKPNLQSAVCSLHFTLTS